MPTRATYSSQVTVENWVYDQKVEVDVTQLYAFGEETIPDDDVSDADSPVVTLDGYDIANGYDINGSGCTTMRSASGTRT